MNNEWQWWLLALLVAVAAAVLWAVRGRLPREEDDVGEPERAAEASWISRLLVAEGADAPPALVERVLELHRRYLVEPPPGVPFDAGGATRTDAEPSRPAAEPATPAAVTAEPASDTGAATSAANRRRATTPARAPERPARRRRASTSEPSSP